MNHLDRLSDLIAHARAAGADAADAVLVAGTSLSVARRLGKTEHVERSEGQDLGLRVFIGKQAAIVSATSIDPAGFAELAERAVAMAKVVPEDPYAGLAETAAPPEDAFDLDMVDPAEPSAEDLIARAAIAEDAALAVPGVTNSEGADAGFSRGEIFLVDLGRVRRASRRHQPLDQRHGAGGRGHRHAARLRLRLPRCIWRTSTTRRRSAEAPRTGRWRGSIRPGRKPRNCRWCMIRGSRPRCSGSLMGAINGASVARGTSFLKEKLGQKIFASGIFVHDDPRRVRGPRSRVFDGEGTPTKARALIEDGVLTTWLLDSRSARQLGMVSTGHASRGTSGPPSPSASNLWLAAGTMTPDELMADIKLGLYITEMMGGGVNGVTGDYSRGAAGFLIRDGKLAEPVAEITVAGHAMEMFANLTPANDLVFRRGTDSPTVRVEGLTMAGA